MHIRSELALYGVVLASLLGACAVDDKTGDVIQESAASGATGTILAKARLDDAEVEIKWGGHNGKVKGDLDLVMQELTIQPGGHTGWHTHGGMVMVSVVAGALTLFDSDAPCDGTAFAAGTAFVDPGDDHVHLGRNLGTVPTLLRLQYVLPAGGAPRIDAPAPPGADACP